MCHAGRRAHHRERRTIVLLIRALANADRLQFPIEIQKVEQQNEPPDFLLKTGGRRVALEITEAATEKSQAATTESEKAPRGTLLEEESRLVPPGEELTGRGMVGDEAERRWAEIVLGHIQKKTSPLPRFQPADDYELLIYDNTHLMLDEAMLRRGAPFVAEDLESWEVEHGPGRRFSTISIVKEAWLLFDLRGERKILPTGHQKRSEGSRPSSPG